MVVSKKCKICTALEADNISISGEYFDKSLPVLIERICGIELDPRKTNGVLICKQCAIQLVHTDAVIDKLRNTLQRLTKILKVTKPKTPSKSSTKDTSDQKNADAINGSIMETGDVPLDEPKAKSTKKVVRRKSVFQEASLGIDKEEPKDNVNTLENGKANSNSVTKAKTPKKVPRRKSLFPGDIVVKESEEPNQNSETSKNGKSIEYKKNSDGNITSQVSSFNSNSIEHKYKVEPKQETPKKVLPQHSLLFDDANEIQQNDKRSDILPPAKFKKIVDDEVTPVKVINTAKRKQISNTNSVAKSDKNLNSNIFETTPVKRKKTASLSTFEESPMDLTIDEQDFKGTNKNSFTKDTDKILNCVICGKAFSQKGSLREHIESSHMGEKLKQCSHCSTEFRSQQKYEAHVFSEKCKNSKHVCQYPNCNKRFKTVHKMDLHMQEKHSSSQQESENE